MNQHRPVPESSGLAVGQVLLTLKTNGNSVFLSWLLLSIFLVVIISLVPNVYRATTMILVDPQKIPERYVASTVTSDPNERLNTLTQQVLSASRLQEIIDKEDLYPQLRGKKSREELLDYMRSKTTIELKQGSDQGLSSFSISYEDQDRQLVALVANQLASSFIDWNLKVREQQALGTTEFLSSELEDAKKSLEQQEAELQAFRMQHVGATPDQLNGNLQALSRLQTELQSDEDSMSRLDQERILLTQTKPAETRDTPTPTERGRLLVEKHRLEDDLANLKRQYTDTYPDVVIVTAQLKSLNARLAAMPEPVAGSNDSLDPSTQVRLGIITKELQRRQQQQAELQRQMNGYQGKVDSVPVLETQLAELTRNYEVSKQNYQSLLDKRFSAGMSEDLERKQQAERFQVLDVARTPEKPVKPKRLPLFAGAIVFALLLSGGATVLLDMLKGAVKSEADLRSMLPAKVAIIGTIPPITTAVDQRRSRIITIRTALISLIACAAFIAFLLKFKPIL
jgi:polysaccharide chain length determinant protein (PEP-CTERM system associated)